ncbi:MAG TPA: hybrid sensor histidine kinase/response regulator, partial [Bacteroidales bacterium]|nr:hybrid sensor histidine kinase/response regulator [Bacteroidales bacterium]
MKKILLVEDEAPIRESLQEILEMHGFEAITAENGREGFYLASTQKPDLIISDVQMPELTGYEMLELLQKNADLMHIPFIFLTSQIEHEKVRTGMNLGADDYLAKPVRMRDLLTAVENRLQKSERIKLAFDDKINDLLLTINKNVQHEFNTPLHGILGFSDLILSSQNLSPDSLKMFANAIQIAGLRLKDTLDNIMLYRSLLGNSE